MNTEYIDKPDWLRPENQTAPPTSLDERRNNRWEYAFESETVLSSKFKNNQPEASASSKRQTLIDLLSMGLEVNDEGLC